MNNLTNNSPLWKEESDTVLLEELIDQKELVLFNDDVNTFEHVIEMLVKYCKHDTVQAEQCAYIVHYNGKCAVKNGAYEELVPVCTALLESGLSAEIQ